MQTQEEVAVKLVSKVVMDSHVACIGIFMIHVGIVFFFYSIVCVVVVVNLWYIFHLNCVSSCLLVG